MRGEQRDQMRINVGRRRSMLTRGWRLLVALGVLAVLLALATLPPFGAGGPIPVASAHALLVRSDPAADQILRAPPRAVRLWFSEDLNAGSSMVVVVDTANREVDSRDSHLSASDSTQLDVSLPLLPAGTYVVAWRAQSADDGHVTSGSFIFRIARPDGSVPPVPATLPTGHFPGAGGAGASGSNGLDGPTAFQALATWTALVLLAFWVGGLIWETWVLTPESAADPALTRAARLARARFRRLAPYALVLLIVANVGVVLGQSAELAGGWSGAVSPPLLRAVLFDSEYGRFWWMREIVVLLALALLLMGRRRGWNDARADLAARTATPLTEEAADLPDWRREVLAALRGIPRLPRRLVVGARQRSWSGRLQLALAAALLVAFALSGHAAAVPTGERPYAVSVDLLHLLANAAWVGGLLYIAAVLLPALGGGRERDRARVLALGLPAFSALAVICAVLLAVTGSLNTSIHLTSITQFVTTTYGITLAIKIELFLLMVAISAYHAFYLRPRLAHALREQTPLPEAALPEPREALAGAANRVAGGESPHPRESRPPESVPGPEQPALAGGTYNDTAGGAGGLSAPSWRLAERLGEWLQREALLGVGVLLCVALLGAFAGTLAPAPAGTPSNTAAPSGPFTQTQTASGYVVTLTVAPATFGTNTFTVKVRDAQGHPVEGAAVQIETTMLDMDMGVQTVQLQPQGARAPGTYTAQSDLTMAGHWQVTVKLLPPASSQSVSMQFELSAGT
jgi:copper transport protein